MSGRRHDEWGWLIPEAKAWTRMCSGRIKIDECSNAPCRYRRYLALGIRFGVATVYTLSDSCMNDDLVLLERYCT